MKTTLLKSKYQLVSNDFENDINGVVCSDLLSLVMGVGECGNAFVTVQNSLNSIAIASLHDFSCIILTYGQKASDEFIMRANECEIAVFETDNETAQVLKHFVELGVL